MASGSMTGWIVGLLIVAAVLAFLGWGGGGGSVASTAAKVALVLAAILVVWAIVSGLVSYGQGKTVVIKAR